MADRRSCSAREIGRDGNVVYVRPELVVEIALDGVQASTRYPGGVALRFARVRRYRDDKSAAEPTHRGRPGDAARLTPSALSSSSRPVTKMWRARSGVCERADSKVHGVGLS